MPSENDLLKKFMVLQERLHSLFEESVSSLPVAASPGLNSGWSPAVDVYETDKEFVFMAELPGVEQDTIDLQVSERCFVLRGERHLSTDVPKQNFHRLERPFGRFERRFELPEDLDSSGSKAKMVEGVLTVSLPKKKGRRRSLKVEVNRR